jgi:hypothetical protein
MNFLNRPHTYLWRTTLQQEKLFTEKAEHNRKILLYKTLPKLNALVFTSVKYNINCFLKYGVDLMLKT